MTEALISSIAALPPARLSEGAREFIMASARPNTRRAYAAQLRGWIAHCEAEGVTSFPADPIAVANWLATRAARGQSVSTLRTAVAALKAGHDAKGLTFDSTSPAIARTLRGVRNAGGRLPRQAEPLRGVEIIELLAELGPSPIGRRNAALLALGYAFALRRSELVGLDLETLGTGTGVLRITARQIEIALATSKTAGADPEVVAIPRAENAEVVRAVEAWLSIASVRRGEPIFRNVRKSGEIGDRLSAAAVSEIIKSTVIASHVGRGVSAEKASADAARFSGHSLRVGFAVAAAEAGADIRAIASVTRHRSMAMPARYSQKADQLRTSPHRLRGVGLSWGDQEK